VLTRKQRLLGSARINSKAIVSGTYTVTPRNVRFNIKIVATRNREVLAMATRTVPQKCALQHQNSSHPQPRSIGHGDQNGPVECGNSGVAQGDKTRWQRGGSY